MGTPQEVKTKLLSRLKALRLPGFREGFEELARKAVEEELSYGQYPAGTDIPGQRRAERAEDRAPAT